MAKHPKASGLLTHEQIWAALDRLAARAGLSPSALARSAGLDPTTFNKSKRITGDGPEYLKLGGKVPFPTPHIEVPPVPKPPEQKVSEEIIRKGEKLYVSFYCEGCHSPFIDGSGAWVEDGAIPDLRYAPPEVHKDWYGIVLGGSHWSKGMPGLADPPKFAFPKAHMTVAEADAVHA